MEEIKIEELEVLVTGVELQLGMWDAYLESVPFPMNEDLKTKYVVPLVGLHDKLVKLIETNKKK